MHELMNQIGVGGTPYEPYAVAGLTFALYMVGAWLADLFLDRAVRRLTGWTATDLDDRVLGLLHRPVYYTVLLVGVTHTLDVLRLSPSVSGPVRKLVWTVLTLLWMTTVIRVTATVVESLLAREQDSTGLGKDVAPLAENAIKVLAVASAVGAVLMIWDVDVTPFVASAGLLGAGLAFAAKDSLSNLFGGISIFLDKPYKIGDYVVLDKGERGEVTAIGLRSTRVLTRDNVQITIPNSIIANTKVINESAPMPNYRVRVPVGVAYGSDIDLVEEILVGVARANSNVVEEPAPRARFRRFGDSALEYELLCWAREPSLRGLTVHEINREIYLKFAARGISIPFPQRDVHVYREDAGRDSGA